MDLSLQGLTGSMVGRMIGEACATFEGPETYAFVVNNHGPQKLLSLIQTDNEGGGAKVFLTGEAQRQ